MNRWPPRDADALDQARDNGLLAENHFVDIKRELPPPPKNRDLAIDLAAFSVDGGVIFVGVDEDMKPAGIAPIPLAGLAERIEQVGLASVDPPVRVRTHAIENGPGMGVLVVVVPSSPQAPHMVDGRYRGRGDKTNIVLTDADVTRIRAQVQGHVDDTRELLEDFVELATPGLAGGTMLLVVGRPITGRPDLVLREARADPYEWVTVNLLRGPLSRRLEDGWGPDFLDGLPVEPRAGGWAITRHGESGLDLEIHEDGVLRLRTGGLDYKVLDDQRTINDIAINGLVRRVIMAAGVIGESCSYFGPWDFGLVIAPMRGRHSESARRSLLGGRPPYSEDGYEATTSATLEEIQADPVAIVERLLGRLNRAFGGSHPLVPR